MPLPSQAAHVQCRKWPWPQLAAHVACFLSSDASSYTLQELLWPDVSLYERGGELLDMDYSHERMSFSPYISISALLLPPSSPEHKFPSFLCSSLGTQKHLFAQKDPHFLFPPTLKVMKSTRFSPPHQPTPSIQLSISLTIIILTLLLSLSRWQVQECSLHRPASKLVVKAHIWTKTKFSGMWTVSHCFAAHPVPLLDQSSPYSLPSHSRMSALELRSGKAMQRAPQVLT